MQRIIDPFTNPADHLAVDEAMLLAEGESFRTWEFARPIVVAGRSTPIDQEIDRAYCESRGIPIMRRCSGGASVVGGPGCLMYSIVLDTENEPGLRRIDVAHRYVMTRVLKAVRRQLPDAEQQGTCDLTWQNRKCSGNSLRITRQNLLYHGTILYEFDLDLISRILKVAPRQPEYRQGRDHDSFVTNVPIAPERLIDDLCEVFQVSGEQDVDVWSSRIRELRRDRYDRDSWHFRH